MGDNHGHVDRHSDLSIYKRKYPRRICLLKQERHCVSRGENINLKLQQGNIKRNFTMREFNKMYMRSIQPRNARRLNEFVCYR